jgi:hypothetical protein
VLKRFIIFLLLDATGLPKGIGGWPDIMRTDDGRKPASFDSFEEAHAALAKSIPVKCNVAQIVDTHEDDIDRACTYMKLGVGWTFADPNRRGPSVSKPDQRQPADRDPPRSGSSADPNKKS